MAQPEGLPLPNCRECAQSLRDPEELDPETAECLLDQLAPFP